MPKVRDNEETIGPCRLIHGDCTVEIPQLMSHSINAVITDPPYAIVNQFGTHSNQSGKGTRRLQFDWDNKDTPQVVAEGLRLSLAMCQRSASLFVFCSIDIVGALLPVARDANFTIKPAAWVKKCPPPAGKGMWWTSAFELAFYGYRDSPWFGDTDNKRNNVFVYDSYRFGQPGKIDHPTQKPIALMKHIIRAIVPPNGICIDPFMGSCTTGVACIETGRRFIGIEKEEKYINIARKRIRQAMGTYEIKNDDNDYTPQQLRLD